MRLHKIERGRYVLYGANYKWQFKLEVSRTYNFGLGWNFKKEESDVSVSFYLFKLFSIWFTLNSKRFKYRTEPIETGFVWDIKQHVITIKLLSQRTWDSSKDAVIDKYWDYRDWLFGRAIYSESHHNSNLGMKTEGVMKMPEGNYKMRFDFYTSYWHRPRSPFVKSLDRVEITPEKPVPTPGKGENSWDMGEDATHGSTMPLNGRTIDELIADFKKSTMERRERYGGKNWLPKSSTPTKNKDK